MKSEIISVGTELLLGNIVNTNCAFLSGELAKLGIDVYFHVTSGQPTKTNGSCRRGHGTLRPYITTGLGPTSDDITRKP